MTKRETAVNTPVLQPGRNGGALLVGGGRNGGAGGRPSFALRARAREIFEKGSSKVEEILDDPLASNADKIRAWDTAGKFGLGEAKIVIGAELVDAMTRALLDEDLSSETTHRIVDRLFENLQHLG